MLTCWGKGLDRGAGYWCALWVEDLSADGCFGLTLDRDIWRDATTRSLSEKSSALADGAITEALSPACMLQG